MLILITTIDFFEYCKFYWRKYFNAIATTNENTRCQGLEQLGMIAFFKVTTHTILEYFLSYQYFVLVASLWKWRIFTAERCIKKIIYCIMKFMSDSVAIDHLQLEVIWYKICHTGMQKNVQDAKTEHNKWEKCYFSLFYINFPSEVLSHAFAFQYGVFCTMWPLLQSAYSSTLVQNQQMYSY